MWNVKKGKVMQNNLEENLLFNILKIIKMNMNCRNVLKSYKEHAEHVS